MVPVEKVEIQIISHNSHRYQTLGDYFLTGKRRRSVLILASRMQNYWHSYLIAFHEFYEWMLITKAGIEEADIMAFDLRFEGEIKAGLQDKDAEPGEDSRAPYHQQHMLAYNAEKGLACDLGIDWDKYEAACKAMFD